MALGNFFERFKAKEQAKPNTGAEQVSQETETYKSKRSHTLYSIGINSEDRAEIKIGRGYETLELNSVSVGDLIEQLQVVQRQLQAREARDAIDNSNDT
jgi:FtsZ-binding cell division protein ZapB